MSKEILKADEYGAAKLKSKLHFHLSGIRRALTFHYNRDHCEGE
jgi:hypothetical protein